MTTPRPQEYVLAAFILMSVVGPAIAGLLWHLIVNGIAATWRVFA